MENSTDEQLRSALCVRVCDGYPDPAIRWGVIPAIALNTLENALFWFHRLEQQGITDSMRFTDDAAEKFKGMITELTGVINLCKKEGEAEETAEEITERCFREAVTARQKQGV
jgi:hypothetical protein